jgi:hypothetical protein
VDPFSAILQAAFRHSIRAANVEEGFESLQPLSGGSLSFDAFREAIDACLRNGLIREPVRLSEGALQCHWRLELTPAGVEAARTLLAASSKNEPF